MVNLRAFLYQKELKFAVGGDYLRVVSMMRNLHPVELHSVYSNEAYKVKEERTVFLNGVALTDEEIEREEEQNILMFELYLGAQALSLAKKLERERHDYFESLYDFSYGVVNLSDEPVFYGSTESRALYILDEKDAYDLRIYKLKNRYSRFRDIVSKLLPEDEKLLRNYFEHGHKVVYSELRECMGRITPKLIKQEEARGKLLDAEANEKFFSQSKIHEDQVSPKNEMQPYLIKGEFIYMSSQDFSNYQNQQLAL